MKRKLTALFLVLSILIGALPMTVFADNEIQDSISETEIFPSDVTPPPVEEQAEAELETDVTPGGMDEVENSGNPVNAVTGDSGASLDVITDETTHFCSDTDGNCLCDVCGNEYHQFAETACDSEGHWGCCVLCQKQTTEKEAHTDTNTNGKCDKCGYRVGECAHIWGEWYRDQSHHSRFCSKKGCGAMESSAHTMSNGVCTVCGYTPCAEGHSFTGFWQKAGGYYMHRCDICGYIEVCEDANMDCICDICGIEMHSISWTALDSEHHQEICEKCGQTFGDPELHCDANGDGICFRCNYQIQECTHENADVLYDYEGHLKYCPACRTTVEEKAPHTMVDEICTVCGFALCTEHSYLEYSVGYHTHTCVKCWMSEECVDTNHDCVCDICGSKTHPNYTYAATGTLHWRFCSDCGQSCDFGATPHEDLNDDGKCDECGYQMKTTEPEPEPSPEPDPKPDTPEATQPEEPEEEDTVTFSPGTWSGKAILSKYRTLHKKNADLYGWITIPGTKIDYPVMYAPSNPEKYLELDFDRNPSQSGTPFLKDACDLGRDIVVIYAANMEDGSMFHGLQSYAEEDFWKENTEILFDTLYESGKYEVVAAFYTEEYQKGSADFQIDDILHVRNSQEYRDAVSYVQEHAIYDTGVAVNYGDGLLVLITDADSSENGRFVVVAKRK